MANIFDTVLAVLSKEVLDTDVLNNYEPDPQTSGSSSLVNLEWNEIYKLYPGSSISTEKLYDAIGGGLPDDLARDRNNYENSCAIRMSRGLNYSGIALPKAPSSSGNRIGKDGFNYWLRVADLKVFLIKLMHNNYPLTEENGGPTAVNSFLGKKGIIVFDVSGWTNASGHFTLWDGKNLRYVGRDTRHNDPSNTERYYFSMEYTTPSGTTVKTTKIRLWELD